MTKALVVSDPVISAQAFHADALAALGEAGIAAARFDGCGIDARCSHIDEQGGRVRREGIDGVVCIGGGSVMCTGKGVAIVATNNKPMRDCTGVGRFDKKALPMIMVPTTAGSGSEVSQWTIVKDEERHLKLLGGGPLSFPEAAILDPDYGDTWAWWYKFLLQHGTEEKRNDVVSKCVLNEPNHGEVWQAVWKAPENAGLGTEAVLKKVAVLLE